MVCIVVPAVFKPTVIRFIEVITLSHTLLGKMAKVEDEGEDEDDGIDIEDEE